MRTRALGAITLLTVAAAVAACSSSTTPTPVTTTATALQSVTPAGGATGVATNGPMTMTFNAGMGLGMEQFVDLHLGDIAGPGMAMTCAWSADRTTLTCLPGAPLNPDTMYTLHVGGGLMDASGMRVNMDRGLQMGGQRLGSTMMNGIHAGQSMSMMASGWRAADQSYGTTFPFRTAK